MVAVFGVRLLCRFPRLSHCTTWRKAASVRTGMTSGHVGLALMCSMEDAAGKAAERTVLEMTANIDNKTRRAVYKRDGYRCALCDSTDGLQIHHVKPRGRGGADHPMNLITLCWRCHAAAHGNMIDASCYANVDPLVMRTMTPQQRIEAVMYEMELACVQYVADYYAEQGEIWYPWEG